ncbi:carboxymuconolactone decarboxylase family protein [Halorarum salinum]|uniref:Carboxymuconolactone decarboxylase family protein n=1 Tax=Halorarum salinum TaxID=2743089 RepID=A0A7D5QBT9_9EURY|nr:carboxymuconolactone decarboxylase family protein [Halobaculum salinum]QLG62120.1 carboxymuconolactone decarboxylase family protein [Halobaculum salinum]
MARVPYTAPDDVPAEHRDLLVSALQDRPLNVYRALGNNPAVLAGLRGFLSSLWADTGLSERERELVILATAREVGNEYEWHQHVRIARGIGIPHDEVAAIGAGDFAPFEGHEAALLAYARATLRGEVDDDRHDAVAGAFDDATAVGVAALAEGYAALGGVIDALDVELEDGEAFVGWDPRE